MLEPFHTVVHDYGEHGIIRLHSFVCDLEHREPKVRSHTAIKWVTFGELASYDFAPADIAIVERLVAQELEKQGIA